MTYNIPDPTWAYFQIFDTLQAAESELKQLLEYISQQENQTAPVDDWVKTVVANVIRDLEEVLDII